MHEVDVGEVMSIFRHDIGLGRGGEVDVGEKRLIQKTSK